MTKLNITLEGKTYEVEVEELGGGAAPAPSSGPVRPSEPQAAPRAHKPAAPKAAGGNTILAPMPGTILEVNVSEGQSVKAGEVVLILEAMKMANEVVAPQDGKIVKISTSKGAKVASGDLLVTLG